MIRTSALRYTEDGRVPLTRRIHHPRLKNALLGRPWIFNRESSYVVATIRRFLAICLAEFLGTAIFIFLGCASTINTTTVGGRTSHLVTVCAFIFGIGASVIISNHISGSVLNPALTLVALIMGHTTIIRCVAYMIVQVAGGYVGVILNYILVPDLWADYCMAHRSPMISPGIAFLMETLNSTVLVWALLGLIDNRRIATIRNIAIKFIVVLIPLLMNVHPIFGSAVNPAFALGGALASGNFKDCWIFTLAPFVAAIGMSLLYIWLFDYRIEDRSQARRLYQIVQEEYSTD